jgi:hypothetical protein
MLVPHANTDAGDGGEPTATWDNPNFIPSHFAYGLIGNRTDLESVCNCEGSTDWLFKGLLTDRRQSLHAPQDWGRSLMAFPTDDFSPYRALVDLAECSITNALRHNTRSPKSSAR